MSVELGNSDSTKKIVQLDIRYGRWSNLIEKMDQGTWWRYWNIEKLKNEILLIVYFILFESNDFLTCEKKLFLYGILIFV